VDPNELDTFAALPRQNSRLYRRFFWFVLGSGILAMIMFLICTYTLTFTSGVVNQTVNPWAPVIQVEWAATCGLIAVVGLCTVCVHGLLLLARPAWYAQLVGRDVMMRRADLRRWPRLSGLTSVWAGMGIVGLALTVLMQGPELVPSRSALVLPLTGIYLVIYLLVTYLPFWLVMIAASLVPHPSR
jgi:hypothetical protein